MIACILLQLLVVGALAQKNPAASPPPDQKDLISAVKRLERKLGFRRTHNFRTETADSAVAYRCYYTGKLELPESYEKLQLVEGTKTGCPLDPQKYDIFFYPLEAAGSGKTPLSAALQQESTERFLVVVPHEDFHSSKPLRKLPAEWGEASSTLIGFLTAGEVAKQQFGENSEVYQNLVREPELFARKAALLNHFHAQLTQLYAQTKAGQISRLEALHQKQQAFDDLHQQCTAITPAPKSFNRCLAANNNAGLAFDETYTRYYPLLYQVYLAHSRQIKPTVNAIEQALQANTEAEALVRLQSAAHGGR